MALAVWLLLFSGDGGTEYTLLFQNAGQLVKDDDVQVGGRRDRLGARRSSSPTTTRRAIKITVEEPYAPLREGTAGRHPAHVAVGHRQPLRRADARRPATPRSCRTAPRSTPTRRPTSSTSTRSSTRSTSARAATSPDVIKGFATQYEGKGAEAGQSTKYFNPLLSSSRRLVQQVTEDEGALTRFLVNSSRAVTAIAERRDDLADLVANANATASAIGQRERRAGARARPAADHAAAGQHDVREPARDARRPRRAGRRVQARDQGPGAVPARAAPAACATRGRRSTTCARSSRTPRPGQRPRRGHAQDAAAAAGRRAGVPQRPPGADQGAAGARVRPALHARPRRLVPRLRPGRRQLRRQRPLRAHPADLQRLPVHRQPGRRRCSRRSRRRPHRRPRDRHDPRAARAPPRSRPPDGSAPFTDGGSLDCDPALVPPGP